MKTPRLLIALFAAVATLTFTGCNTTGTTGTTGTAAITSGDPVIIAEQTASTAQDTFELVLQLEYNNRALLQQTVPDFAKQFHAFCNNLRHRTCATCPPNEVKWVQSLREVTEAYRANRTAENKASLDAAFAVVTTALQQSQQYITQVNQKKG